MFLDTDGGWDFAKIARFGPPGAGKVFAFCDTTVVYNAAVMGDNTRNESGRMNFPDTREP